MDGKILEEHPILIGKLSYLGRKNVLKLGKKTILPKLVSAKELKLVNL